MTFAPFQVKVPATSANLGPGFDSIGLALDIYQTVMVLPSSKWSITYEDATHSHLSQDDDNLIMATINDLANQYELIPEPAMLVVHSSIPLSRGLGSSAAAIVAGIEIANQLMNLQLTDKEKLLAASEIEGHPDNVSAALVGGLTVSRYNESSLHSLKLPVPSIGVLVMIPTHELLTSESRESIPETINHKKAFNSSSAANVLVAALATGNWSLAGEMMEKDEFHVPFRTKWIDSFEEIKQHASLLGAFGTTISGAGPSIIIFVQDHLLKKLQKSIQFTFPLYQIFHANIDQSGSTIQPIYLKENMQPPV